MSQELVENCEAKNLEGAAGDTIQSGVLTEKEEDSPRKDPNLPQEILNLCFPPAEGDGCQPPKISLNDNFNSVPREVALDEGLDTPTLPPTSTTVEPSYPADVETQKSVSDCPNLQERQASMTNVIAESEQTAGPENADVAINATSADKICEKSKSIEMQDLTALDNMMDPTTASVDSSHKESSSSTFKNGQSEKEEEPQPKPDSTKLQSVQILAIHFPPDLDDGDKPFQLLCNSGNNKISDGMSLDQSTLPPSPSETSTMEPSYPADKVTYDSEFPLLPEPEEKVITEHEQVEDVESPISIDKICETSRSTDTDKKDSITTGNVVEPITNDEQERSVLSEKDEEESQPKPDSNQSVQILTLHFPPTLEESDKPFQSPCSNNNSSISDETAFHGSVDRFIVLPVPADTPDDVELCDSDECPYLSECKASLSEVVTDTEGDQGVESAASQDIICEVPLPNGSTSEGNINSITDDEQGGDNWANICITKNVQAEVEEEQRKPASNQSVQILTLHFPPALGDGDQPSPIPCNSNDNSIFDGRALDIDLDQSLLPPPSVVMKASQLADAETDSDCPWLPERQASLSKVIAEREQAEDEDVANANSPDRASKSMNKKDSPKKGSATTDDDQVGCNCAKMCVIM